MPFGTRPLARLPAVYHDGRTACDQSLTPEREWIVSMLGGERAERLDTVTAPDMDAAIAEAIKRFEITDPERQRRAIVRPIAEK
jgi:Ser/Thr protein kinase RdoA (MazF antagonist)